MTDWPKIQAEYIEGNLSMTALADKRGVNPNTLRYHARNEKWAQKREAARRRSDEIRIEAAAVHRAEMAEKLDEAALKAMQAIIEILERHKDGGYTRLVQTTDTETEVFDLLDTVEALAKLARIYGLDAASKLERQRVELLKHTAGYSEAPPCIIIDARRPDDEKGGNA